MVFGGGFRITNLTEGLHEFIFIGLSFDVHHLVLDKAPSTYAVWMTLNWLLITGTAFVVSVPAVLPYLLSDFHHFCADLAVKRPLVGPRSSAWSRCSLLSPLRDKFAHGTWAFLELTLFLSAPST